ncbi:hypothetical protein [Amycolatopsis sp. NPDC058986]|uniref:hypothetical protein n=1 Tax=Amycolatopsis sp. NPDC058986 TaxID=3346685 RepID=UPI00366AE6AA
MIAVALLAAASVELVTVAPIAVAASASAGTAAGQVDWRQAMVRRLTEKDARSEVRLAAWNALLSKDVDAAITRFLAPGGGYETAKARAARNAARNEEIIRRVLSTTSALTSPAVHAAATRASHGTLDEQDEFVRTGWDEARAQDEKSDGRKDREVARQAQADRDYVAGLAANAPGPWVRAAAARAVSTGDAGLVEFFGYEWASAARCDVQAYRVRMADAELLWQARLSQLVSFAEEAEAALARAEAAVVDKARAAATQAWRTVADHAATAEQGWEAERQRAAEQAKSWSAVAEFAKTASTAQDWTTIARHADDSRATWAEEQSWAQAQAAQWRTLVDTARADEFRVAASH